MDCSHHAIARLIVPWCTS